MSFQQLPAELEQRARITGRRFAIDWEQDLKRTSPVDTGNMRDRTTVRDHATTRGVAIEALVDTDYARFVSEGTAPHVITPVNAQALRFEVGGRTVFAASVNHPGTQPDDWWDESLRRNPDRLRRAWA